MVVARSGRGPSCTPLPLTSRPSPAASCGPVSRQTKVRMRRAAAGCHVLCPTPALPALVARPHFPVAVAASHLRTVSDGIDARTQPEALQLLFKALRGLLDEYVCLP